MISTVRIVAVLFTLVFPFSVHADLLRFDPRVNPDRVLLECASEIFVTDTQTRDEIAQRYGIIGNINAITELIGRMQALGYRRSGSGGGEVLSRQIPIRLSYTRPMEFRVKADGNGMTLGARRLDGNFRATVAPQLERYISPQGKQDIERAKERWVAERREATDNLRSQLHEKPFPWNNSEKNGLRSRTSGTYSRDQSFRFCNHGYRLVMRAEWQRRIDGPLGN